MTQPANTAPQPDFALAPAIFVPFTGLPKDFISPGPLDQKSRIELNISNLDKHHEGVRRNMVSLIEQHAANLVANAQAELAREGLEEGESELLGRAQYEEMMRKVKAGRREGSKGEEYEVRKENFATMPVVQVQQQHFDGGGDTEMGGMLNSVSKPRTATQIRADLSRELRGVVEKGISEMEMYDRHARETTRGPRDALRRGMSMGQAILKNRHVESPIDGDIRRMSNGMPVAAFSPTPHDRRFESIGELSRRGSK